MQKTDKIRKVVVLLLAIMCASVAWAQGNTDTEKRRIAVYLTASQKVDSDVKRLINNQIITALTRTGRYEMIERNEAFVKQIDKERTTQLSGRVSDDQITKLGKEYGAIAICIVDVGTLKEELTVDMRMVNVERATVIRSGFADGYYSGTSDIRKIVDKAAADMLGTSSGTTGNDKGVMINGVKWATCNVAAPGVFAEKPEDAGMFYQWNRKKAWAAATREDTNWDNTLPSGDSWAKANDPSPAGWRVPTLDEIRKLLNESKVKREWISVNGINGYQFTDKETGNAILPAIGDRQNRGRTGNYWSSTQQDRYRAYILAFDHNSPFLTDYSRGNELSVRSVAD